MFPEAVEWKVVDGFPTYRVTVEGEVWSYHKHSPGDGWKRLTPCPDTGGYLVVSLTRGGWYGAASGRRFTRKVHRLVLEAFIGPCPAGHEARHFPDFSLHNNRLDNLQWALPEVNNAERRLARGEAAGRAKLTEGDVLQMRRLRRDGYVLRELADLFGVTTRTAWCAVTGKTWSHLKERRKWR